MEKVWNKYKWVFLFLINTFPVFAFNIGFFFLGAGADVVLFLPILTVLTVLNYWNCNKVFSYILYQILMFVCIISAGCISVWLYCYVIIGHDDGTLFVGALFVVAKAIIIIVTTIITTVLKAIENKKVRTDG